MTKTILVADDSKTMQKIVELTFRTTQFTVVKASSAEEALMKIPRARPDVILADTQMPGKDGYQLCEELHGNPATAQIPVLLLLGNTEALDEGRAAQARAAGHLKKPFDTQTLIHQVTELAGLSTTGEVQTPMSFAASLAARQGAPAAQPGQPFPAASPPPATAVPSPVAAAPAPAARPITPTPAPQARPMTPTPSPMAASRPVHAPVTPAPANPTPAAPVAQPFAAHFPAPSPASPQGAISGRSHSASWPAPASARPAVSAPDEDALKAPMLEPPRRPSPEHAAHAAKVDMWSMADPVSEDIPMTEASSQDLAPPFASAPPVASAPPPRPVLRVSEEVAARAAPQVAEAAQSAQAAGSALSKDELVRIAREIIERVAWEVVPDLAESIIREELRRLTRPEA